MRDRRRKLIRTHDHFQLCPDLALERTSQPWDDKTSFGPLISAAQRDKVLNYINIGKGEGAKVATGGVPWSESKGFYVEPTILTDCTADMRVVQEEM